MIHLELLKNLIRTTSFSGEEHDTADIIEQFFSEHRIAANRYNNNIVVIHPGYAPFKKTIMLNSHHDTVKVGNGWTKNPFGAEHQDDILYGLGSNDAGGSLVCMIATFLELYDHDLPYNLVLAATAEEENFGPKGLSSLLEGTLPHIDFGIIGEPTSLQMGVAQKGLIVIDAEVHGKAGHAARKTGINAINECLKDLEFLRTFQFPLISQHLGPVTQQVTMINAGVQHNVVPDLCTYVIDVRVNDHYTNEEIMAVLSHHLKAELKPRSLRWQSKGLNKDHPIFNTAEALEINTFGSPTLSDQVHCSFPTIKFGPGDSERSHTADEYIRPSELEAGISTYLNILNHLRL
jgi:acetylornithine deacetylase